MPLRMALVFLEAYTLKEIESELVVVDASGAESGNEAVEAVWEAVKENYSHSTVLKGDGHGSESSCELADASDKSEYLVRIVHFGSVKSDGERQKC